MTSPITFITASNELNNNPPLSNNNNNDDGDSSDNINGAGDIKLINILLYTT